MSTNIPFTDAELAVKQIDPGQLNDLGRSAMSHAFTGYLDRNKSAEQIAEWAAERKKWSGVDWHFDASPYRRYAGDASLPRARYYSVAKDAAGNDDGTLVSELRTYYNAHLAGIIQIWDSTEPRDAQFLSRIVRLDSPNIVVIFLPFGEKPNPFTARFTDRPKAALLVTLPLTITTLHVRRVIDLRLPATAEWFAQSLSRAEWDVGGMKTKCFAMRPPLESFRQLLPALLEQCVGGSGFTNLVGIWLRKIGVNGLVYPSARVDAAVEAIEDRPTASSGFCFVDYANSPAPIFTAIFDVGLDWPKQVQATPEGPGAPHEPLVFGNVRINYAEKGTQRGSWQVIGLRQMRELIWRISMLGFVIEELRLRDGMKINETIVGWLMFGGLPVETTGGICQVIQEGLMGIPGQTGRLVRLVEDVRKRGAPELYNALHSLYEAAKKQGVIAGG